MSKLVFEKQRNDLKPGLNFNTNPNFDAKLSELWEAGRNIILLQNSLEIYPLSTRKCWLSLLASSHLLVSAYTENHSKTVAKGVLSASRSFL